MHASFPAVGEFEASEAVGVVNVPLGSIPSLSILDEAWLSAGLVLLSASTAAAAAAAVAAAAEVGSKTL